MRNGGFFSRQERSLWKGHQRGLGIANLQAKERSFERPRSEAGSSLGQGIPLRPRLLNLVVGLARSRAIQVSWCRSE